MRKLFQIAVIALMLAPSAGVAQDFDAGLRAYDAGDFATALSEWMLLADQGNARAQYNLALMYEDGTGVPQDYAAALKWYRLAAGQGEALAQVNLALMYANGTGVPQDYSETVKWLRLAADQGHADAQHNLGVMYAIGEGILQDYLVAHMWFNLASASAHAGAKKYRDQIAAKMTPADISIAQKMARQCMASNYQDCG